MRVTLKKKLFLALFWKKTFQKLKQIYFRFENTFVSQMFSNFHFSLQIKIFSFQKQKQFCFRFENTFISQLFSKYRSFHFEKNLFSFRKHLHFCFGNTQIEKNRIRFVVVDHASEMITGPEWTPAGVCILGWSRSRSQYFRFEPE